MFSLKFQEKFISSLALVCFVALFSLLPSLSAEEFAYEGVPEQVHLVTPYYQPKYTKFKPPLGSYTYKVSWQGIPAAFVTIEVDRDGLNYKFGTKVRTNSAIDIFYKLRYQAQSEISTLNFQPVKSFYESRENSRFQRADLIFSPEGEITSLYKKNDRDLKVLKFNPNNVTLDPFSAAFIACSLDWKVGDTRVFDTFNGKSRYLIELKAIDKRKINVAGEEREAWLISPSVEKLGGKPHSKLRQAEIFVSADNKHEILQINSKVFVGTVKTRLMEYKPSKKTLPAIDLASLKRVGDKS